VLLRSITYYFGTVEICNHFVARGIGSREEITRSRLAADGDLIPIEGKCLLRHASDFTSDRD
jgi:hypothetical protein